MLHSQTQWLMHKLGILFLYKILTVVLLALRQKNRIATRLRLLHILDQVVPSSHGSSFGQQSLGFAGNNHDHNGHVEKGTIVSVKKDLSSHMHHHNFHQGKIKHIIVDQVVFLTRNPINPIISSLSLNNKMV